MPAGVDEENKYAKIIEALDNEINGYLYSFHERYAKSLLSHDTWGSLFEIGRIEDILDVRIVIHKEYIGNISSARHSKPAKPHKSRSTIHLLLTQFNIGQGHYDVLIVRGEKFILREIHCDSSGLFRAVISAQMFLKDRKTFKQATTEQVDELRRLVCKKTEGYLRDNSDALKVIFQAYIKDVDEIAAQSSLLGIAFIPSVYKSLSHLRMRWHENQAACGISFFEQVLNSTSSSSRPDESTFWRSLTDHDDSDDWNESITKQRKLKRHVKTSDTVVKTQVHEHDRTREEMAISYEHEHIEEDYEQEYLDIANYEEKYKKPNDLVDDASFNILEQFLKTTNMHLLAFSREVQSEEGAKNFSVNKLMYVLRAYDKNLDSMDGFKRLLYEKSIRSTDFAKQSIYTFRILSYLCQHNMNLPKDATATLYTAIKDVESDDTLSESLAKARRLAALGLSYRILYGHQIIRKEDNDNFDRLTKKLIEQNEGNIDDIHWLIVIVAARAKNGSEPSECELNIIRQCLADITHKDSMFFVDTMRCMRSKRKVVLLNDAITSFFDIFYDVTFYKVKSLSEEGKPIHSKHLSNISLKWDKPDDKKSYQILKILSQQMSLKLPSDKALIDKMIIILSNCCNDEDRKVRHAALVLGARILNWLVQNRSAKTTPIAEAISNIVLPSTALDHIHSFAITAIYAFLSHYRECLAHDKTAWSELLYKYTSSANEEIASDAMLSLSIIGDELRHVVGMVTDRKRSVLISRQILQKLRAHKTTVDLHAHRLITKVINIKNKFDHDAVYNAILILSEVLRQGGVFYAESSQYVIDRFVSPMTDEEPETVVGINKAVFDFLIELTTKKTKFCIENRSILQFCIKIAKNHIDKSGFTNRSYCLLRGILARQEHYKLSKKQLTDLKSWCFANLSAPEAHSEEIETSFLNLVADMSGTHTFTITTEIYDLLYKKITQSEVNVELAKKTLKIIKFDIEARNKKKPVACEKILAKLLKLSGDYNDNALTHNTFAFLLSLLSYDAHQLRDEIGYILIRYFNRNDLHEGAYKALNKGFASRKFSGKVIDAFVESIGDTMSRPMQRDASFIILSITENNKVSTHSATIIGNMMSTANADAKLNYLMAIRHLCKHKNQGLQIISPRAVNAAIVYLNDGYESYEVISCVIELLGYLTLFKCYLSIECLSKLAQYLHKHNSEVQRDIVEIIDRQLALYSKAGMLSVDNYHSEYDSKVINPIIRHIEVHIESRDINDDVWLGSVLSILTYAASLEYRFSDTSYTFFLDILYHCPHNDIRERSIKLASKIIKQKNLTDSHFVSKYQEACKQERKAKSFKELAKDKKTIPLNDLKAIYEHVRSGQLLSYNLLNALCKIKHTKKSNIEYVLRIVKAAIKNGQSIEKSNLSGLINYIEISPETLLDLILLLKNRNISFPGELALIQRVLDETSDTPAIVFEIIESGLKRDLVLSQNIFDLMVANLNTLVHKSKLTTTETNQLNQYLRILAMSLDHVCYESNLLTILCDYYGSEIYSDDTRETLCKCLLACSKYSSTQVKYRDYRHLKLLADVFYETDDLRRKKSLSDAIINLQNVDIYKKGKHVLKSEELKKIQLTLLINDDKQSTSRRIKLLIIFLDKYPYDLPKVMRAISQLWPNMSCAHQLKILQALCKWAERDNAKAFKVYPEDFLMMILDKYGHDELHATINQLLQLNFDAFLRNGGNANSVIAAVLELIKYLTCFDNERANIARKQLYDFSAEPRAKNRLLILPNVMPHQASRFIDLEQNYDRISTGEASLEEFNLYLKRVLSIEDLSKRICRKLPSMLYRHIKKELESGVTESIRLLINHIMLQQQNISSHVCDAVVQCVLKLETLIYKTLDGTGDYINLLAMLRHIILSQADNIKLSTYTKYIKQSLEAHALPVASLNILYLLVLSCKIDIDSNLALSVVKSIVKLCNNKSEPSLIVNACEILYKLLPEIASPSVALIKHMVELVAQIAKYTKPKSYSEGDRAVVSALSRCISCLYCRGKRIKIDPEAFLKALRPVVLSHFPKSGKTVLEHTDPSNNHASINMILTVMAYKDQDDKINIDPDKKISTTDLAQRYLYRHLYRTCVDTFNFETVDQLRETILKIQRFGFKDDKELTMQFLYIVTNQMYKYNNSLLELNKHLKQMLGFKLHKDKSIAKFTKMNIYFYMLIRGIEDVYRYWLEQRISANIVGGLSNGLVVAITAFTTDSTLLDKFFRYIDSNFAKYTASEAERFFCLIQTLPAPAQYFRELVTNELTEDVKLTSFAELYNYCTLSQINELLMRFMMSKLRMPFDEAQTYAFDVTQVCSRLLVDEELNWKRENIHRFIFTSRQHSLEDLMYRLDCLEYCHAYQIDAATFEEIKLSTGSENILIKLHHSVQRKFNLRAMSDDSSIDVLLTELDKLNRSSDYCKLPPALYAQIRQVIIRSGRLYSGSDCAALPSGYKRPIKLQALKIQGICDWNEAIIRAWFKHLNKHWNKLRLKENIQAEICAVLMRACKLTQSYPLRVSQLIAFYLFMTKQEDKGRFLQIRTGEGKSIIIAMAAVYRCILGDYVDIVTSSPILSNRDFNDLTSFYATFGLSVASNDDHSYVSGEKGCYEKDIVYGQLSNFQFDYLRHFFSGLSTLGSRYDFSTFKSNIEKVKEKVMKKRRGNFIIIDELDNLLVDERTRLAMLADLMPGLDFIEVIYVIIWRTMSDYENKYGELPELDEDSFLKLENTLYDEVSKKLYSTDETVLLLPKHLEAFIKNQIRPWIRSMLTARYTYLYKGQYTIEENDDKEPVIRPIDFKNTGITLNSTSLADGLNQFLQIKHGLRITPERLTTNYLSNLAYVKKYKANLFGVSGTLGQDSEHLYLTDSKSYNADCIDVPTHRAGRMLDLKEIICDDSFSWLRAILRASITQARMNRVVLALFESMLVAQAFQKLLDRMLSQNRHLDIRLVGYIDSNSSQHMNIKHIFEKGTVVVSTNLAGRGTNINISGSVRECGGIHVIKTTIFANSRVEAQATGRGGRKGEPGSSQFILNKEDIRFQLGKGAENMNLDSIVEILSKRDELAKVELSHALSEELVILTNKDYYFERFLELLNKLMSKNTDVVRGMDVAKFKKYKRQSIQERWAIWLKLQDFKDLEQLKKNFTVFETALDDDCKKGLAIIHNPFYAIQLGNEHLHYSLQWLWRVYEVVYYESFKKIYSQVAAECFKHAAELDESYAFMALYNMAMTDIDSGDKEAKQKIEERLRKIKQIIASALLKNISISRAGIQTDLSIDLSHSGIGQVNHTLKFLDQKRDIFRALARSCDHVLQSMHEMQANVTVHRVARTRTTYAQIPVSEMDQFAREYELDESEVMTVDFTYLKKVDNDAIAFYDIDAVKYFLNKESTIDVIMNGPLVPHDDLTKASETVRQWLPINRRKEIKRKVQESLDETDVLKKQLKELDTPLNLTEKALRIGVHLAAGVGMLYEGMKRYFGEATHFVIEVAHQIKDYTYDDLYGIELLKVTLHLHYVMKESDEFHKLLPEIMKTSDNPLLVIKDFRNVELWRVFVSKHKKLLKKATFICCERSHSISDDVAQAVDSIRRKTVEVQHEVTISQLLSEDFDFKQLESIEIPLQTEEDLDKVLNTIVSSKLEADTCLIVPKISQAFADRVISSYQGPVDCRFEGLKRDKLHMIPRALGKASEKAIFRVSNLKIATTRKIADRLSALHSEQLTYQATPAHDRLAIAINDSFTLSLANSYGFSYIVNLFEKLPIPYVGLSIVVGSSAAQMVAGTMLIALTGGFGVTVGQILLTDGFFDLFSIPKILLTRQFSLEAYTLQKALSYILSFSFAGITTAISHAVKAGNIATKSTANSLATEAAERSTKRLFGKGALSKVLEHGKVAFIRKSQVIGKNVAIKTAGQMLVVGIQPGVRHYIESQLQSLFQKGMWTRCLQRIYGADALLASDRYISDLEKVVDEFLPSLSYNVLGSHYAHFNLMSTFDNKFTELLLRAEKSLPKIDELLTLRLEKDTKKYASVMSNRLVEIGVITRGNYVINLTRCTKENLFRGKAGEKFAADTHCTSDRDQAERTKFLRRHLSCMNTMLHDNYTIRRNRLVAKIYASLTANITRTIESGFFLSLRALDMGLKFKQIYDIVHEDQGLHHTVHDSHHHGHQHGLIEEQTGESDSYSETQDGTIEIGGYHIKKDTINHIVNIFAQHTEEGKHKDSSVDDQAAILIEQFQKLYKRKQQVVVETHHDIDERHTRDLSHTRSQFFSDLFKDAALDVVTTGMRFLVLYHRRACQDKLRACNRELKTILRKIAEKEVEINSELVRHTATLIQNTVISLCLNVFLNERYNRLSEQIKTFASDFEPTSQSDLESMYAAEKDDARRFADSICFDVKSSNEGMRKLKSKLILHEMMTSESISDIFTELTTLLEFYFDHKNKETKMYGGDTTDTGTDKDKQLALTVPSTWGEVGRGAASQGFTTLDKIVQSFPGLAADYNKTQQQFDALNKGTLSGGSLLTLNLVSSFERMYVYTLESSTAIASDIALTARAIVDSQTRMYDALIQIQERGEKVRTGILNAILESVQTFYTEATNNYETINESIQKHRKRLDEYVKKYNKRYDKYYKIGGKADAEKACEAIKSQIDDVTILAEIQATRDKLSAELDANRKFVGGQLADYNVTVRNYDSEMADFFKAISTEISKSLNQSQKMLKAIVDSNANVLEKIVNGMVGTATAALKSSHAYSMKRLELEGVKGKDEAKGKKGDAKEDKKAIKGKDKPAADTSLKETDEEEGKASPEAEKPASESSSGVPTHGMFKPKKAPEPESSKLLTPSPDPDNKMRCVVNVAYTTATLKVDEDLQNKVSNIIEEWCHKKGTAGIKSSVHKDDDELVDYFRITSASREHADKALAPLNEQITQACKVVAAAGASLS